MGLKRDVRRRERISNKSEQERDKRIKRLECIAETEGKDKQYLRTRFKITIRKNYEKEMGGFEKVKRVYDVKMLNLHKLSQALERYNEHK